MLLHRYGFYNAYFGIKNRKPQVKPAKTKRRRKTTAERGHIKNVIQKIIYIFGIIIQILLYIFWIKEKGCSKTNSLFPIYRHAELDSTSTFALNYYLVNLVLLK